LEVVQPKVMVFSKVLKIEHMKRVEIDEIDFDLEYEGYVWYSNQQYPEIRSTIRKSDFMTMPFIIEGNLFAKNERISISIKNVDGEYLIMQGDLSGLPGDQITELEYITTHKLPGISKVKLVRFWDEVEDEFCEGMKTLKPSWKAFKGFVKK